MLLSAKTTQLLNEQLAHELHNNLLYMNVASFFSKLNMNGFVKFFLQQASGEVDHRNKIWNYMDDKNAEIQINQPSFSNIKFDVANIKDLFKIYYDTEIGTTKKLYTILSTAMIEGDYGTEQWLLKPVQTDGEGNTIDFGLITEQIEEENTALNLMSEVLDGLGNNEQLNMQWLRHVDARLLL